MKLLLDTHVVLWALTASKKLPPVAQEMILDRRNDVYISAATVWEIAIKHALSPKAMPISSCEFVEYVRLAGYIELAITSAHAAAVEKLPLHHHDPFDRMLVAQALTEPLRLLTHDRQLAAYGEPVMLV